MRFALLTTRLTTLAAFAIGLSACGEPIDEAAATRGKAAAEACLTCHSFDTQHKVGPHLRKVIGRTAGTAPGYEYSDAMRNSKIVWTEESLERYLKSPMEMIPGTKMALAPLTDQQTNDIVEFIKSQD
jgi:cytochrome c